MKQLTFPTLFGVTPPADNTAPYTASYTIVDSSDTDGSYNISTLKIPSAVPREWTR